MVCGSVQSLPSSSSACLSIRKRDQLVPPLSRSDEGLRIYVHVRLPVDTPEGATEPIISSTFANTLFSQFDIHIEASVADPSMAVASTYNGSSQQTSAAYRLPSRPPSTAPGSSVPTSPRLAAVQLHKRDSPKGPMENVPFYAHTYNPKIKDIEAIVFRWEGAWSCLYPLTIPIGKKSRWRFRTLSV